MCATKNDSNRGINERREKENGKWKKGSRATRYHLPFNAIIGAEKGKDDKPRYRLMDFDHKIQNIVRVSVCCRVIESCTRGRYHAELRLSYLWKSIQRKSHITMFTLSLHISGHITYTFHR